jgi:catechol 2,3-dioxygenase-like lactoylglutathione lyase family enzyme
MNATTPNPSSGLADIGQIAIAVSDVPAALSFYRDVLGLPHLFSAGPNLAFLQAGTVRLMLSTPQGAGAIGANSVLYFRVAALDAVHADLVARGATAESAPHLLAEMPDHDLWMSFLRDPDGNLVGLMEERR